MASSIIMPKAGMAMEEGTIVRWMKEIGDPIAVGEAILEIETDKVTMEVEAESAGILLAKLKDEGEVVPVIETIGYIGAEGEELPQEAAATDETEAPSETAPLTQSAASAPTTSASSGETTSGGLRATPAARRIARERGVSLEGIRPQNRWNAVLAADVLEAKGGESKISPLARKIAAMENIDTSSLRGSGPQGRIMKRDLTTKPAEIRRKMSGMRSVIAKRMSAVNQTVPSVTLNRTAVVDRLIEYRQFLNRKGEQKVSLNDMILKAVAAVLPEHPMIRTRLEDDMLVEMPGSDIGIAVALPEGLIVPVVRDVESLSLQELAAETRSLAQKARDGKLLPDEMQGAIFSVSNLGMYGIYSFNPIINLPEAAILGVGTIEERLSMQNGLLSQKNLIHLSLTIDHRIIDGATGALFLKDLAQQIESPYNL